MTTKSRKPNRFEMAFLFMWHGALTGGVLLTYISGDAVYFLHQFAGYVVCGAILLRLLAALIAPKNSPLCLTLPPLFARRQGGRSPIFAWMAVALITSTALAAFSGLLAQSFGFDDIHEAFAEAILPMFIFAHMGIVLWKPVLRWLSNITADDLDRTLNQATTAASTLSSHSRSAARTVKSFWHNRH